MSSLVVLVQRDPQLCQLRQARVELQARKSAAVARLHSVRIQNASDERRRLRGTVKVRRQLMFSDA